MASYLTRKYLSRRTFLRGSGVALGLPFLDAMVPAAMALEKSAAAPKTRAGFFYFPHGAIMNNTPHGKAVDAWSSTGQGADFRLGSTVASLEPVKRYVTTIENLDNAPTKNSVHTIVPATWLSCVTPDTQAKGASMSVTVDQIIAQKLGQGTALPSLELSSETTIQVGACGGAGCYYASTLSYSTPTTPLPMEYNPRKVFIQLMGEGDTAAEREALLRKNASMLDMVADRTRALRRELGPADRAALSDYLDNVREVERRVAMADSRQLKGVDLPDAPVGVIADFDQQVRLMFDLLALAYQADLTRVAAYVMAAEATNRTYNHVGISDAFHPVSHHSNDLERIRRLTVIQRYHVERFADFVKKLAAIKEGDGSILDHSLFLYGSNIGNSNNHDNYPLPILLAGGANGAHRGGKNLALTERTPLANLHLTILDRLEDPAGGVRQQHRADRRSVSRPMTMDRRDFLSTTTGAAGLAMLAGLPGCQSTRDRAAPLPSQLATDRRAGAHGRARQRRRAAHARRRRAGRQRLGQPGALATGEPRWRPRALAVQHAPSRRPDRRQRAVRRGGRNHSRTCHHARVARDRLLRAGRQPLGEGAAAGGIADRDVSRFGLRDLRCRARRIWLPARGAHAR